MVLNRIRQAWNSIRKEILLYVVVATGLTIWGIVWYYHKQINKNANNDYRIETEWAKYQPQISGINTIDAQFQHNLRDYYIASSYNSCCGGDFQDDYVSIVPLRQAIYQGARVLDFGIYLVGGNAVVAASPVASVNVKGTYNSIPVEGRDGVFAAINKYAFNGKSSPNPDDPLIIHLRIKSDHPEIYTQLTKAVRSAFAGKLLDAEYGYEGRPNNPAGSKNLAIEPLLKLRNRVIIICDQAQNNFRDTPFEELVNLSAGSPYFQEQRNYDIQYTHDPQGVIEYNKKNMTLTMPDLSSLNNNVPAQLHMSYGCQMVSMNYQNLDSRMKHYFETFNNAGSSFVLKPAKLRYIPVVVKDPPPQNPQLSYAPRSINLPMYKTSI